MAMFDKYYAAQTYDENDEPSGWGVWNAVSEDWHCDGLTYDQAKERAQDLNDERNDSGIPFCRKGHH